MTVGNARGFNAPRIADDDFGAVFPGFDHPAGDDWMGVGAVVAKDQQAFRVFDVADRVAHRPVAQRLLQPGDRGPWQTRAQQSTLLVLSTARANFCIT